MPPKKFAVLDGVKIQIIKETRDADYDYLHLADGDTVRGNPADVWAESGRLVEEVSASWNYRRL